MKRIDGRAPHKMRPLTITRKCMKFAEGSCLIEMGNTRVLCTASVENSVPLFLRDKGRGWVTAEYGMLPRSCKTRAPREASKGKVGGRTHEIQRLIGRCLRAVVDMTKLGERTLWIDCDVLQADGGTRTASITGSFIALADALCVLRNQGIIAELPLTKHVAAVSVGIVNNTALLDLNYEEDSQAQVDMNVVMTSRGEFVELQGTAEKTPFSEKQLAQLTKLAQEGINTLIAAQRKALPDVPLLNR